MLGNWLCLVLLAHTGLQVGAEINKDTSDIGLLKHEQVTVSAPQHLTIQRTKRSNLEVEPHESDKGGTTSQRSSLNNVYDWFLNRDSELDDTKGRSFSGAFDFNLNINSNDQTTDDASQESSEEDLDVLGKQKSFLLQSLLNLWSDDSDEDSEETPTATQTTKSLGAKSSAHSGWSSDLQRTKSQSLASKTKERGSSISNSKSLNALLNLDLGKSDESEEGNESREWQLSNGNRRASITSGLSSGSSSGVRRTYSEKSKSSTAGNFVSSRNVDKQSSARSLGLEFSLSRNAGDSSSQKQGSSHSFSNHDMKCCKSHPKAIESRNMLSNKKLFHSRSEMSPKEMRNTQTFSRFASSTKGKRENQARSTKGVDLSFGFDVNAYSDQRKGTGRGSSKPNSAINADVFYKSGRRNSAKSSTTNRNTLTSVMHGKKRRGERKAARTARGRCLKSMKRENPVYINRFMKNGVSHSVSKSSYDHSSAIETQTRAGPGTYFSSNYPESIWSTNYASSYDRSEGQGSMSSQYGMKGGAAGTKSYQPSAVNQSGRKDDSIRTGQELGNLHNRNYVFKFEAKSENGKLNTSPNSNVFKNSEYSQQHTGAGQNYRQSSSLQSQWANLPESLYSSRTISQASINGNGVSQLESGRSKNSKSGATFSQHTEKTSASASASAIGTNSNNLLSSPWNTNIEENDEASSTVNTQAGSRRFFKLWSTDGGVPSGDSLAKESCNEQSSQKNTLSTSESVDQATTKFFNLYESENEMSKNQIDDPLQNVNMTQLREKQEFSLSFTKTEQMTTESEDDRDPIKNNNKLDNAEALYSSGDMGESLNSVKKSSNSVLSKIKDSLINVLEKSNAYKLDRGDNVTVNKRKDVSVADDDSNLLNKLEWSYSLENYHETTTDSKSKEDLLNSAQGSVSEESVTVETDSQQENTSARGSDDSLMLNESESSSATSNLESLNSYSATGYETADPENQGDKPESQNGSDSGESVTSQSSEEYVSKGVANSLTLGKSNKISKSLTNAGMKHMFSYSETKQDETATNSASEEGEHASYNGSENEKSVASDSQGENTSEKDSNGSLLSNAITSLKSLSNLRQTYSYSKKNEANNKQGKSDPTNDENASLTSGNHASTLIKERSKGISQNVKSKHLQSVGNLGLSFSDGKSGNETTEMKDKHDKNEATNKSTGKQTVNSTSILESEKLNKWRGLSLELKKESNETRMENALTTESDPVDLVDSGTTTAKADKKVAIIAQANLTSLAHSVLDGVQSTLEGAKSNVADLAGGVAKTGIKAAANSVKTLAQTGQTGLRMGQGLMGWMKNTAQKGQQAMESGTKAVQAAVNKAADVAKKGMNVSSQAISSLGEAASSGLENLHNLAEVQAQGLEDIVDNAVNAAKNSEVPLAGALESGRKISQNMVANASLQVNNGKLGGLKLNFG